MFARISVYMKDDRIQVSEKHVGLRVVFFVVAVVVAVGAFSYGISALGAKQSGYHLIEASADSDAPFYNKEITFGYYLEGSSGAIKKATKELVGVYTPILAASYKQLDSSTEYAGAVSIGALNRHLGEEVGVSAELYAVLKDAYARTLQNLNFNMFAGALYAEWKSVLILDDPVGFDPLTNEDMAARFADIAAQVSNLDNFSLEFLDDENHIMRFSVSDEYAAFCKEMEIEAGALDLNLLANAYRLEMIASALEDLGFTDGYLLSQDGLAITLSGCRQQGYALYGMEDGSIVERGSFVVEGRSCKAFMSAFPLGSYSGSYYSVVDGRFRHLFFDTSTGEIHDVVMACTLVSLDGKAGSTVGESLEDGSPVGRSLVDDMAYLVDMCALSSKDSVIEAIVSLGNSSGSASGDVFVDLVFQDGTDYVVEPVEDSVVGSSADTALSKEVL